MEPVVVLAAPKKWIRMGKRVACSVFRQGNGDGGDGYFSQNTESEIGNGSTLKPRFTREKKSHWTMALKPIKSFHQYEE
jgi:hypothetical protein